MLPISSSNSQILARKMRQERILDGALEVFKTKGLERSTMEEIAEESGFAKASLYYYFQSKEEVFSSILENGWQMLLSELDPVISSGKGPRQTFVQVLLKYLKQFGATRHYLNFYSMHLRKLYLKHHPGKSTRTAYTVYYRAYWKKELRQKNFPI